MTELLDMLPSSANVMAPADSLDEDSDENSDAALPSSLPALSVEFKKFSEDLTKANSIEDLESLEHRVGRLRSEVLSAVERIEKDIDAAMKESKSLNDALQLLSVIINLFLKGIASLT